MGAKHIPRFLTAMLETRLTHTCFAPNRRAISTDTGDQSLPQLGPAPNTILQIPQCLGGDLTESVRPEQVAA